MEAAACLDASYKITDRIGSCQSNDVEILHHHINVQIFLPDYTELELK